MLKLLTLEKGEFLSSFAIVEKSDEEEVEENENAELSETLEAAANEPKDEAAE